MKLFQYVILYSLLLFTLLQLISCAPASYVRVGVDVNVPNSWEGPYPSPADSANIGRPAPESENSLNND